MNLLQPICTTRTQLARAHVYVLVKLQQPQRVDRHPSDYLLWSRSVPLFSNKHLHNYSSVPTLLTQDLSIKESNMCTNLSESITVLVMIHRSGAIQELITNDTCLKFSTHENMRHHLINFLDDSWTHKNMNEKNAQLNKFIISSSTNLCPRIK